MGEEGARVRETKQRANPPPCWLLERKRKREKLLESNVY
jgi:hypothetical protein